MIDDTELAAWLRLLHTPGVTRGAARRLLARFGSAQAVLDASPVQRQAVVEAALARALGEPPPGHAERLAATRRWRDTAPAEAPRHVVPLGDPAYPPRLLEAADPPLLLHVAGRVEALAAPSLAIVGSRHATAQGLDHARAFARFLSERQLTIVSGLAVGIDAAAHEGALAGAGGTLAVVGTGLDIVYPARHAALAARIERHGALVSEHALGTPPRPLHFPQRNRLIAGLALGTLVVEAAPHSGSLITARLAAEAGREVFAIPGSVHAPQARGCHQLIRQGAKLVETGEDVLEELRGLLPPGALHRASPRAASIDAAAAAPDGPDASEDPLLAAMGHDPIDLDTLGARTGLGAAALGARLLDLELAGRVARLPGGRVQRRARA